jgi:hypothetical protein
MRHPYNRPTRWQGLLAALALATLALSPAQAQLETTGAWIPRRGASQAPCPTPSVSSPTPTETTPTPAPTPAPVTPPTEPIFSPVQSVAGGGESVALTDSSVGYIDSAIPRTMFRLRADAGWDLTRPDRAEFFYAEWKELSFHTHGVQGDGTFFDAKARGPNDLPDSVNYQEVSAYFEYAFNKRFSVFVDIPYRVVELQNIINDDPGSLAPGVKPPPNFEPPKNADEGNPTNNNGISDIWAGFKAALIADPDRYLTFQLVAFAPSGSAQSGLGTGHYSLEPGLLLYQTLTERLILEGQFEVWVPIGGGAAEGNILIYGLGLGYDIYRHGNLRVTPVLEFVGWTVLNGFESVANTAISAPSAPPGTIIPINHGVVDASGDTIINGKFGVRTYLGHSDVYLGYGHALTGNAWYRDIVRLEYRYQF